MAHIGTVHYGFRLLHRVVRVLLRVFFWLAALFGVLVFAAFMLMVRFGSSQRTNPLVVERVRDAASNGRIAYRLTEPDELIQLLGQQPTGEIRSTLYDRTEVRLRWPMASAVFVAPRDFAAVLTLREITLDGVDFAVGDLQNSVGGVSLDIGARRPLTPRNANDLRKLDPFFGLKGVLLTKLDLRDSRDQLLTLSFDSLTRWPAKNQMPSGYDPNALLEEGKNPGLGIRALHAEGIDGRGVGIAIVDQPLLENHAEYAARLVRYERLGIFGKLGSPQMHGPAVASIAVGKDCGVAPGASLHFFAAMPLAKSGNKAFGGIVNRILRLNERLPASEKIRVISLSQGAFSRLPHYDQWVKIVERARQQGVLIVTCDPAFLDYGTLARLPGTNPDDPANYRWGRYSTPHDNLYIPAGHRTIASEKGSSIYTYDSVGGMSWCAPYLAGLAALAFQLDPALDPDTIMQLLLSTATETQVGHIVNPRGFIDAVRKHATVQPPSPQTSDKP